MGHTEFAWVDAVDGYKIALHGNKLVCMNSKGKQLTAVPKKARQSEAAVNLLALRDWLTGHQKECRDTVEMWLLRSLPVPREVLLATWDDPAWRGPLENAVVAPVSRSGEVDDETAGFLKGVDAEKGIGVVDLDGETEWIEATRVAIRHPILLPELDDWRELATELSITQGISQLFRETFAKGAELDPSKTSLDDFANGTFEQLNHVLGKCRTLGYRVRGGYAVCPVWEGGEVVEARYWIGAESPESETWTGELLWVDKRERSKKIADVGPVAFSEGMRMASGLYAARAVEQEEA